MNEGNNNYALKYIISFFIATIIFIIVFLASFGVSYLNYTKVVEEQSVIRGYIEDLDSSLDGENTCDEGLLLKASEKLDVAGSRMSLLETRFGKNDARVLKQKDLYSELEVKHFEITKAFDVECGKDFSTILFFYSNSENDKDNSERVGFILSTFKNKNPGSVMIYSFDANLDSEIINSLKTKYGVSEVPMIVVDEGIPKNIRNIDDINEKIVDQVLFR